MSAQFTPGPWVIDPRHYWDKQIGIRQDADGWHRLYCEVDRDDCDRDTAEANARLIAAAPALLEALDFMVNVSRSTPGFSPMAREQAERAIALAKGESA